MERDWGYKSYSEEINERIDDEKLRLVKECEERTRVMVLEKKDKIEALAELLLLKESISFQEIKSILGDKPFPAKGTYKQYLDEMASDLIDEEIKPDDNGPKAATADPSTMT